MSAGKPIEYRGESATTVEWAKRARVSPETLRGRIKALGVEAAISLSLASPGVWSRTAPRTVPSPRVKVRCAAPSCTRVGRAEMLGLCFACFCASVRESRAT